LGGIAALAIAIATDGEASSVGRSVCMSPAQTAEKIEMPFRKWTRTPMDPRNEPCIRWGPDTYSRRGNYEGEKRPAQDMPRHVRWSIYSK